MRSASIPLLLLLAAACGEITDPTAGYRNQPAPVFSYGVNTNQYIVVLNDNVQDQLGNLQRQMVGAYNGSLSYSYSHALKGFAAHLSPGAVQALARDPRVKYIEQDQPVQAIATQSNATWGIDRIDQRALPLSTTYVYNATGAGVTVYIIDTGINFTHSEFGGRAVAGTDEVTPGGSAADCNGHGTHVAGTVGGTTYGVAKSAKLVAVRVLDCAGSGTWAGVVAGIDWVTAQKQANPSVPSVANMSLGGGAAQSVDDAVARSTSAGVIHAVAAGNSSANACNYSPARAPSAITVGATDASDTRASYSNTGTCLDIFAPGSSITSAWYTSNTATNTISGTSMASPHVAGAAALYLETNKSATVAAVTSALTSNATTNVVKSAGTGSPNRLLYTGFITSAPPGPPVANFTSSCTDLTCNFDASSSTAQADATYTWAWGDNTPNGSGITAAHSYAAAGTYTVTLTVTDAYGTSTKTGTVSPTAPPPAPKPTANFTFSCNGLTCTFTNTSTAQANATYDWTWGDGTVTNGVAKTPDQVHTYPRDGTWTVTLTAKDAGGTSAPVSKSVTTTTVCTGECDD